VTFGDDNAIDQDSLRMCNIKPYLTSPNLSEVKSTQNCPNFSSVILKLENSWTITLKFCADITSEGNY
jgi:hypothetical protein